MSAWLYILANKPGGTLYVGVTNDLVRRVLEHREEIAEVLSVNPEWRDLYPEIC
jgi:predicted GIY-YIG superfamily endonuclease